MGKKRDNQRAIRVPTDLRRDLVKLIEENTGAYTTYDVFRGFLEMVAISISNSVDIANREEREKEYMRIVGKYSEGQVNRMAEAFGLLVGIFDSEPFDDVLGKLYMEFELGNSGTGQFFTPYHLCQLIAQIQVVDLDAQLEKGFITVNEPACGAGAMIVALAEVMTNKGYNPQTQMHVVAQDIDIRAVHMAYIQLSLLGIPAVIYHGDTIAMEFRSAWRTPFHIIGGWEWKLKGKLPPGEVITGLAELLTAETNPFVD